MIEPEKEILIKKIYWDYDFPPQEIYEIVIGKRIEPAFPMRTSILLRMLERLSWYEILRLLGREKTAELLTQELVAKIRNSELRDKYEFICKVLSGEAVSFTGWGAEYLQTIKHTLFSNRWYRT